MLAPGTLLQNRYRIQAELARGGMGAVYAAEAVHLGNAPVAVKETFFSQPFLREQFEREAATLARLRHSALPKVTDHFSEGAGQFLVMEFIPGKDLLALLDEQLKAHGTPFHWTQVCQWADQLLDALSYIHNQYPPVIHRDIKPQNLKLTPQGEIVLLDFGLAKDGTTPTRPGGSVRGYTAEYAPPEQLNFSGTDARSDLFSLGATLYHLMTGQPPVSAKTREEVLEHVMPDPLRPAHQQQPEIPFAIAAVLARSLALGRDKRYASATAMREAFEQARQQAETVLAEAQRERERQEAERQRREQEAERKRQEAERALAEQRRLEAERWEAEKREAERQRQEAERQEAERQRQEALRQEAERQEAKRQRQEAARLEAERQEAQRREIERQRQAAEKQEAERQRRAAEAVAASARTEDLTAPTTPIVASSSLPVGLVLAGMALLLTLGSAFWYWQINRGSKTSGTTPPAQPVQQNVALSYALELEGEVGRVTTLDPALGKKFKLHFTPHSDGLLYLLSADKQNHVRTYLTGQRIKANADYVFPDGDNWISSDTKAQQTRITVIFAAQPVTRPAVLTQAAGRELTGAEILELTRVLGSPAEPFVKEQRMTLLTPAKGGPLLFDIVLEANRQGR